MILVCHQSTGVDWLVDRWYLSTFVFGSRLGEMACNSVLLQALC
jgi:hypothetical protein